MNIAFFSDNFYPEISGISDSITRLGPELARRGHHILYVAPHYKEKNYLKAGVRFDESAYSSSADPSLQKNISVFRIPSVRYLRAPTGQSRIAIPTGSALSALKKFKPDIIYTQSPFGTGLEALLDARILRVPLVGTNHTPIREFMSINVGGSHLLGELIIRTTERYFSWYYNRCVFLSAPCNALLVDMTQRGFRGNGGRRGIPHQAVANSIDVASFTLSTDPTAAAEQKSEAKKRYGFSPHTVLYSGRLATEKGVHTVMRAVALAKEEIPDIMFAITGHGKEEDDLHALAKRLNIEKDVKFLGFVKTEDMPTVYRGCDIFAIMSIAETQSLSLMQGMAMGMPAIGARAWGLPEYIHSTADADQNGFILEPEDEQGLAKIFVDLFKNPARMRELGANGIKAVQKYRPAVIAENWENKFKKIIEDAKK